MAIKFYRRHRKECEGGHVEDSRMREFEEGRRGWKKCGCLIHVSGTLGRKFNCKQTGTKRRQLPLNGQKRTPGKSLLKMRL
jgi:hypothetical protein